MWIPFPTSSIPYFLGYQGLTNSEWLLEKQGKMWSLISKDPNFPGIVHYIVLDEVSLVSDLIPSLVGEYICPTVNENRIQWSNISEAKFITGTEATKEAMLIQHLTNAPFHEPSLPHAELRGDNQGTLALACISSENQTYRYDEFSCFTYTYCLAAKDDLRNCLKDHIALVERSTGDRVKVSFDNEPVLLQGCFQEWLRSCGISHFTTQTYSPEMNGIAENVITHIFARASATPTFHQ